MEYRSRSLDVAIGLFSEALEAGDAAPAIDAFATRRGEDGVALADALADLGTVLRIAAGREPAPAEIGRFAVVWSEAAHGAFATRGALDHVTGLATTDYLATRLRDLARTGEHEGRCLVVAPGPDASTPRLRAMLRSARVARELAASFPRGETPTGLPQGRVAVIVPEDEAFDANLARARVAIRAISDPAHAARAALAANAPVELPDVEAVELPDVEDTVPAFVSAL